MSFYSVDISPLKASRVKEKEKKAVFSLERAQKRPALFSAKVTIGCHGNETEWFPTRHVPVDGSLTLMDVSRAAYQLDICSRAIRRVIDVAATDRHCMN